MNEGEDGFEGWAILELMGHRRLGGLISEATIAGAGFLRIDIPHPQHLDAMAATQFVAPASVYAITPTTEEIARAIAQRAPEPVSRWELPALSGTGATGGLAQALSESVRDIVDEAPFD
jgi:hypothetical protein